MTDGIDTGRERMSKDAFARYLGIEILEMQKGYALATIDIVLTGTAREENQTRKTGVYRIEIKDEKGDLVALAEGLAYRPSVAGEV